MMSGTAEGGRAPMTGAAYEGQGWISFHETVANAMYHLDRMGAAADYAAEEDLDQLTRRLGDVRTMVGHAKTVIDAAVKATDGNTHPAGERVAKTFQSVVEASAAAEGLDWDRTADKLDMLVNRLSRIQADLLRLEDHWKTGGGAPA